MVGLIATSVCSYKTNCFDIYIYFSISQFIWSSRAFSSEKKQKKDSSIALGIVLKVKIPKGIQNILVQETGNQMQCEKIIPINFPFASF